MGSLFFLVLVLLGCCRHGDCFIFDDLFGGSGSKPQTSAQTSAPTSPSVLVDVIAHASCPLNIARTKYLMFNTFSKHCFQINVDKTADWHTAKMDCESQGGYLATVKGWNDNLFIGFRSHGALGYHSGNFLWIGLSDDETEGTFKWVTGELFLSYLYNSWDKSEPKQGGSINCVVYNKENDKWSVQNCSESLPWVCQFGELFFSYLYKSWDKSEPKQGDYQLHDIISDEYVTDGLSSVNEIDEISSDDVTKRFINMCSGGANSFDL